MTRRIKILDSIRLLLGMAAALSLLISGCAGTQAKKEASKAGQVRPLSMVERGVPKTTAKDASEIRLQDEIDRILEKTDKRQEKGPASSSFIRVDPGEVPALMDDADTALLRQAVVRSLAYYDRIPAGTEYIIAERICTAAELKASLEKFQEIMNSDGGQEEKFLRIREQFDFYKTAGSDGQGRVTVTGYYEPILDGALERTERFRYPLYRPPEETVTVNLGRFGKRFGKERLVGRLWNGEVVPHYRRFEIETDGVLKGRNLEIAWVDDPVALFFLHVQGSGIIRLPDSRTIQVNYAQKNGWPFRGLAKFLFDQGKITATEMSHRGIVDYLYAHPEEMADIMNYNESYVFFRRVDDGPIGALGFPVTEGRSIAVDLELFPRGTLAFIKARKPRFDEGGKLIAWEPLNRFVLIQDTGGVFKGAGKADLFCGTGPGAGLTAGSLKEAGELFLLIRKNDGGQ